MSKIVKFFVCFLVLFCNLKAAAEPSLDEYLAFHNVPAEANSAHIDIRPGCDHQVQYFVQLLKQFPNIKTIAEIGFNLGHSSEIFLKARPDIDVVSFDAMFNWWNWIGKDYIDETYPGRHQLIAGHSLQTVPQFTREHRDLTFDCIFIDGGHDYPSAFGDLINMQEHARSDTIVIMDDIEAESVSRAWEECKASGLVEELERFPPPNSAWGWAVGRYRK